MVETSEGTFAVDGQELYTKTWLVSDSDRTPTCHGKN